MSAKTASKKSKILIWIVLSVAVIGITAQLLFTQKVKSALAEQIPENISLDYADVSTNIFLGNITLENVELTTSDGKTNVTTNKMAVKGIGYLSLLSGKTVELGEIHLVEPKIFLKHQPGDTLQKPTSPPENTPKLLIKKVKVDRGEVTIRNAITDSLLLEANAIDLTLAKLGLDAEPEPEQPPFTLEAYEVVAQDLYFDVSPYEFMRMEKFQWSKASGTIEDIVFKSKYSPEVLATKVPVQHDHFDVHVDKIQITEPDIFGDTGPKFFAPLIEVKNPKISVYRNSLLPPNTTIKKMPNQMLREMPAQIKIDSISVTDGEVNFYKKTMPDVKPQKMSLTNLQNQIKNLNNTGDGIVTVTGQHQIMDDGNFTLELTFDPQNEDNNFLAKVSMSDFHTGKISPFMRSTLDVEVDGTIQEMYYTIDGNEWTSRGEMKMKYDQFKFVALKKDHLTVNKFKSGVANLLTKKGDRKADEDGFRHGQFEVDRDRTKWILNYIWINMRTGMFHTMVGRGKEK